MYRKFILIVPVAFSALILIVPSVWNAITGVAPDVGVPENYFHCIVAGLFVATVISGFGHLLARLSNSLTKVNQIK